MFKWVIYYHHTFGADEITAWTKKQAKRKAIKILKKEFSNSPLPCSINNCGRIIKVNTLEDIIEDIVFVGFGLKAE